MRLSKINFSKKFKTSENLKLILTKATKKSWQLKKQENKAYLKNKATMTLHKDKIRMLKAFLNHKSNMHVSSQILFFRKTSPEANQTNKTTKLNKKVYLLLCPKIWHSTISSLSRSSLRNKSRTKLIER